MKPGSVDPERLKIESRQPIHHRMSKNAPIVNGAEESPSHAAEEESMVMQVNLAAAFHDHISCTKSPELCKLSENKEDRVTLPCETDHIYATCGDIKPKGHPLVSSKDSSQEIQRLQEMILLQLDLIQHQQEQLLKKERQLQALKQEREALKVRLERMERRVSLLKKKDGQPEEETSDYSGDVEHLSSGTVSSVPPSCEKNTSVALPPVGVTRYLGRKSRTVPLRSLKRRYFGPPRNVPQKRIITTSSSSSATSQSSTSDIKEDIDGTVETATVSTVNIPPSPKESAETSFIEHSKKDHPSKGSGRERSLSSSSSNKGKTDDFLKTDSLYYLSQREPSPDIFLNNETIEVPSWRFHPVTSFYQMEGTENIDDKVFYRRHMKYEHDERRRKRWDIQRIREQRISEKLRQRRISKDGKDDGDDRYYGSDIRSFFPEPQDIEYIEVTDVLPVLAFGHPIPSFQPSEFTLPWFSDMDEILEIPEETKVTTPTSEEENKSLQNIVKVLQEAQESDN